MMKSRKGKEEKMMNFKEESHFVEYQLETFDPQKRDAVMKMLEKPDSFSEKQRYFEQFSAASRKKEPAFWNSIDLALEQYTSGINAYTKKCYQIDVYACCELYGIAPEEYFQFKFYWKNDEGRNQYMGDKERFVVFRPCYNFEEYEKIRNKWLMYQQIGKYFGRKCLLIKENTDLEFEEFCNFLEGKDAFVFKPLRSSCGNGIQKIELSKETDVRGLYQRLCETGGGMADELIRQEKILEKFHPQSANTVRLITLRDKQGKDHFMQSLFRMGQSGSFVDNNSGAIRARIDESNGYVFTCGFDAYGNEYILHPDSKEVIPGFQIPAWEELLSLAGKVMDEISSYARFIGFDLALTENGWTVIEVNPFPQLVIQQIITGQGIRKEMLRLANESVF